MKSTLRREQSVPQRLLLFALAVMTPAAAAAEMRDEVRIQIVSEEPEVGRPIVSGTTNLPDRTRLVVSLEGKVLRYSGTHQTVVENGAFRTPSFSQNGKPLGPKPTGDAAKLDRGMYKLQVAAWVDAQPESVKESIGASGEHLRGPLVENSYAGKVICKEIEIPVGGSHEEALSADHRKLSEARAAAKEVLVGLRALLEKGEHLQHNRTGPSGDRQGLCAESERIHLPELAEWKKKSEALRLELGAPHLWGAIMYLKDCLSCTRPNPDLGCRTARTSLGEAEKAIQVR